MGPGGSGPLSVLMAATVVISGNHWILDVVGAVVTVAACGIVLLVVSWTAARLLPRMRPVSSVVERSVA